MLLGLVALLGVLLLPRLSWRRAAARSMARLFFALTLMRVHLTGLERLPAGACVVVANHASYLDGPLMQALLPPRFAFVIKGEMAGVPVAGLLLRRLGSQFVDRQNRHRGGRDAKRILDLALGGNALGFFPEGTFHGPPGLHRFQPGAFVTAARAGLPVVPVVIRGTRQALGEGQWLPAAARIEVEILDALPPPADEREAIQAARDEARAAILARLGEPDADLRPPRVEA
jgi:1-acyl-sn-glycerol-3-phosphate acyltransferase